MTAPRVVLRPISASAAGALFRCGDQRDDDHEGSALRVHRWQLALQVGAAG